MSDVEGYEYKVQYLINGEWKNTWTNQFDRDEWYSSEKSGKNALAQLRATRYGRSPRYEYRLIKRPYGAWEVVQ